MSSAAPLAAVTLCLLGLGCEASVSDAPSLPNVPRGTPLVLVGAGDIAECESDADEATARLVDSLVRDTLPVIVFTAGDNAYDDGTSAQYSHCYHPSWGRHRSRTKPVAGNHEYDTQGAAGYFGYFGPAAGSPFRGYYSFDSGDWHVIVLNSNVAMEAGSDQERWLRADLAASDRRCVLAIWHHARFSSGTRHGSSAETGPLCDALYESGADLVISAHEHNYERFTPQSPAAARDDVRGPRHCVVGTGGSSLSSFSATPLPTSEVRAAVFGVLKLTLLATSYTWRFVPVAGAGFTDSGSDSCH